MYMPKNSLFNINKFCDPSYQRSKSSGQTNQIITCNPVEYNKVKTATNDPSISSKMRYSQLVKSSRYKQVPPQQKYLFKGCVRIRSDEILREFLESSFAFY